MSDNLDKNPNKNPDKNPIPNNKKFGIDQEQPSPEAKKRGWAMKKAKEISLENFTEIIFKWTFEEIRVLMNKYKNDKSAFDKFTPDEVKAIFYAYNMRNADQHFDRMGVVSKKEIDVTTDGEKIEGETLMKELAEDIKNLIIQEKNEAKQGESQEDSKEAIQQ